MKTPAIRPTFEIPFGGETPCQVMLRLRKRLPDCPRCTGVSTGDHAELFVPSSDRKVWSPWLSVTTEPAESGSVLRGRFSPHPSVWTWYLFCVLGLGFTLLVGLSLAYAQWATDTRPWALLSVPFVGVSALILVLSSQVGQRLGAQQMAHLKRAVEELTRAGDTESVTDPTLEA